MDPMDMALGFRVVCKTIVGSLCRILFLLGPYIWVYLQLDLPFSLVKWALRTTAH